MNVKPIKYGGQREDDILMIKTVKTGITRYVLLIGPWAIKVPRFTEFKLLLCGLLANMQERQWSGHHPALAKVHYANRYGFLLIMERVRPLSVYMRKRYSDNDEFKEYLFEVFKFDDIRDLLLEDAKISNWGVSLRSGRMVKIDYG